MEIRIYLNRHFPSRLSMLELKELTLARVKAYYKKHRSIEFKYRHEGYTYQEGDREFNSYFGTNVEQQIKEYFDAVRTLITEMEKNQKK